MNDHTHRPRRSRRILIVTSALLSVPFLLGACESEPAASSGARSSVASASSGVRISNPPQAPAAHSHAAPAPAAPTSPPADLSVHEPIAAVELAQAANSPTFVLTAGSTLSSFTHFSIEPVGVLVTPSAASASITSDDLALIAQSFRTRLSETLSESFTPAPPTTPDDDATPAPAATLRVRATIAQIAARVDPTSPTGMGGVTLAAAACRVELIDSLTNQTLARFVDASTPQRLNSAAARSDSELAQLCVRTWSELLAQRIDQARTR